MTETTIVIDNLSLNYEGLFSVKDMYLLVDNFFAEKNYDKRESLNTEKVEPQGKFIELELEPYKKVTDYAKLVVKINIKMFNIKEVEIEKDGHKIKINQGKVNILIDGLLQTDWEGRWTSKPFYVFVRTVWDKFIFKDYNSGWENKLKDEVNGLHTQLKAFFNLYRY
jgi:hypothetical protein